MSVAILIFLELYHKSDIAPTTTSLVRLRVVGGCGFNRQTSIDYRPPDTLFRARAKMTAFLPVSSLHTNPLHLQPRRTIEDESKMVTPPPTTPPQPHTYSTQEEKARAPIAT